MSQPNFKLIFFLTVLLILLQNSHCDTTELIVEKLALDSSPCNKTKGEYTYWIKGKFSDSTDSSPYTIEFDLDTSSGNKIKTTCHPSDCLNGNSDRMSCKIDISRYPLENVNVLLPTTAPQFNNINFTNWKETIGANPGESNKIGTNVNCVSDIENVFIPSSVEIGDCFFKRSEFTINGKWENTDKINLRDFGDAKIVLDNEKNDIAECTYRNKTYSFNCKIDGDRLIKIKEQNFNLFNKAYKMKESNSGKKGKVCVEDTVDGVIQPIPVAQNFLFLNEYLILIGLFLLF